MKKTLNPNFFVLRHQKWSRKSVKQKIKKLWPYEDTPLRYRKLLCPASEFQALLCNGYSITNGGYINDIWEEDNNFHDWPQNEKEWPIHLCTYFIWI